MLSNSSNSGSRSIRTTLPCASCSPSNWAPGGRPRRQSSSTTVLQRAPNSLVALNNLAVIYQQQKIPCAVGLATKAYAAAPGQPLIADTYGWLLVDQGKLDEGIEVLRKAAATPGATPEVRYHLAAALARDGQRDAALEMAPQAEVRARQRLLRLSGLSMSECVKVS